MPRRHRKKRVVDDGKRRSLSDRFRSISRPIGFFIAIAIGGLALVRLFSGQMFFRGAYGLPAFVPVVLIAVGALLYSLVRHRDN